jgi:hypothetical protein
VPPSYVVETAPGSTFTYTGRIWYRIAVALNGLGDKAGLQLIADAAAGALSFSTAKGADSNGALKVPDVDGILTAASVFRPVAVGKLLIAKLRTSHDRFDRRDALIRHLASFISKEIVPDVLELLPRADDFNEWEWNSVIHAIGSVADDLDTVRGLSERYQSSGAMRGWSEALYEALCAVSRRARLRIASNGQLQRAEGRSKATALANEDPVHASPDPRRGWLRRHLRSAHSG